MYSNLSKLHIHKKAHTIIANLLLSVFWVVKACPVMSHLFRSNETIQMMLRGLVSLLKLVFAEDGSNECTKKSTTPSLIT